jgi:phosphonate transport system substrate-binding protein
MNIQVRYSSLRLLLLVLLSFCIGFTVQAKSKTDTLRFATYTYSTNNRLANLQPLAAHLSLKTGYPVIAVSYSTVQKLVEAILNDSVDFAMMNTSGYLVLQRKNSTIVSPLINLEMGGAGVTNYGACIIAAKSEGVISVNDLKKSKRKISLALVSSSSTSGNLMPRLMLNDKGIPSAETFFDVYYAGTHKKAVEDVLDGKAALAGCGCAEIDSAKAKNRFDEKAVVIASYNDIPLGPVIYSKRVAEKIVNAVRSELLQVHQNNPVVFRNFCAGWTEFKEATRFKPVSDTDYNAFRKMFGKNEELWKLIE